jgi:hypothetical protein
MLSAYTRMHMTLDRATLLELFDLLNTKEELPYLLRRLKHDLSLELHPCQNQPSPRKLTIRSVS